MRLIDADALLEYLDKRRTYEVMNGRYKAYGKGVRDAMKDVDAAPTIDAIPVEWLENKLNTLCFEAMANCTLYGDRSGELAKSINEVMKLWQKEQEAR